MGFGYGYRYDGALPNIKACLHDPFSAANLIVSAGQIIIENGFNRFILAREMISCFTLKNCLTRVQFYKENLQLFAFDIKSDLADFTSSNVFMSVCIK